MFARKDSFDDLNGKIENIGQIFSIVITYSWIKGKGLRKFMFLGPFENRLIITTSRQSQSQPVSSRALQVVLFFSNSDYLKSG